MVFFLNNNYRGSCVCIFILKMHLFVSEESIQVPWTCSFEPQSELVRTRLFLWSDLVNIPIVYRVWHNFRQDRIWKWISFCIVCKKYFDKLHSVFHFFFFFCKFCSWQLEEYLEKFLGTNATRFNKFCFWQSNNSFTNFTVSPEKTYFLLPRNRVISRVILSRRNSRISFRNIPAVGNLFRRTTFCTLDRVAR